MGIGLLSACTPNNCIATQDPNVTGEMDVLDAVLTAATTYYITVDSFYGATTSTGRGGFVLSVGQ